MDTRYDCVERPLIVRQNGKMRVAICASVCVSVCECVWMCVSVCVFERERERSEPNSNWETLKATRQAWEKIFGQVLISRQSKLYRSKWYFKTPKKQETRHPIGMATLRARVQPKTIAIGDLNRQKVSWATPIHLMHDEALTSSIPR